MGTHVNPTCMIPFLTGATGVLSSWFCGNAQFDLIGQLHLCAIYKTHHRRSGAETVWGRRVAPRSAQTYPRCVRERGGKKAHLLLKKRKQSGKKEDCVFLCIAVSIIILLHSTDINIIELFEADQRKHAGTCWTVFSLLSFSLKNEFMWSFNVETYRISICRSVINAFGKIIYICELFFSCRLPGTEIKLD